MPWNVVYEVDWRDVFTSLGAVDLNSPGNTLTFDGVTWTTPAVVDGNPVDQVASTTWALEAGGLRAVSPNNSRMLATNNSAPHIYATLAALGANTATPFAADTTRKFMFQVYVSALTVIASNASGAGVAVYKTDLGAALGNANIAASYLGHFNSNPNNIFQAGVGGAPGANSRPDEAPQDIPTVHYVKSGMRFDGYCGDLVADDWPDNEDLHYIGSYRDTTDLENDVIGDNVRMRVALYHNAAALSPNAYDGTIQRFRILQF